MESSDVNLFSNTIKSFYLPSLILEQMQFPIFPYVELLASATTWNPNRLTILIVLLFTSQVHKLNFWRVFVMNELPDVDEDQNPDSRRLRQKPNRLGIDVW